MKKRKWLYGALAGISFIFIVYALADNFIFDPEAKQFLSHKTGLRRELKPAVWLNVMRIHVALACIAMATGLINFLKRVRDRSILVHRINGYVYLISVLVVVLTSGYMAPYATGGKIASIGFNAINMIWLIITATALVQIKKSGYKLTGTGWFAVMPFVLRICRFISSPLCFIRALDFNTSPVTP